MLDGTQIFVDEPAEYEPRGDHIVSRWKGHEFVMPIAVANKALARLEGALAKWQIESMSRSKGVTHIGRKRA